MDTGEILIYQSNQGDIKIDVRLEEETVWLTQEQMATLFGKAKSTINEHIKNIYSEGELEESRSLKKFGNSEFQQKAPNFYNLDVIISVGYRVKSQQGTQFRIWATQRLKEYIVKGFALNDERFKTGSSMNYFTELQERIREIRISEKFFYQKIKDIYATSIDYNPKDEKTILFFKVIQNKLLWAISQQTAAELVYRRVDATLPLMGMLSHDKKSTGEVKKADVSIAKNYLTEDEMRLLGLLVEQYLAFAETMADEPTDNEETDLLYGGYNPLSVTLTHIINNKAGIGWTSYSHTGVPVPVYATGASAELFNGAYENTEVAVTAGRRSELTVPLAVETVEEQVDVRPQLLREKRGHVVLLLAWVPQVALDQFEGARFGGLWFPEGAVVA